MDSRDRPIHVLLVEDSPADGGLIEEYLRRCPLPAFSVQRSNSLSTALALAAGHRFDVALLDLGLPDSSGPQTIERFCEGAPDTPVVVLTGHDDEALAVEAVDKGAQDYLVKQFPFKSSSRLARTLRQAIERGRLQREVRAAKLDLERLCALDPLTGLLNRRGLGQVLKTLHSMRPPGEAPPHVLFIDVDDLKAVNDAHGHSAGDFLLRKVSQIIRHSIRHQDGAARIGGDEFIVLLPGTPPAEAAVLGERVRAAVAREPFHYRGKALKATVSIALIRCGDKRASIDTLLTLSHPLLRQAKQTGKNTVCSYEPPPGRLQGQDYPGTQKRGAGR